MTTRPANFAQAFRPQALVEICLRDLGLMHEGSTEGNEPGVEGAGPSRKLVNQALSHKRMKAVMQLLRDR